MGYFVYKVTATYSNQSVKSFLQNLNLGKTKIYNLVSNKNVYLNHELASFNTIIKENDTISIDLTNLDDNLTYYEPYNKALTVLYEDEYFMILDKPSDVIIYDENNAQCLANMISNYYKITKQDFKVRPIHRLDRNTTGCILIAKDAITHSKLTAMLENDEIKRYYLAVVSGNVSPSRGKISFPIGTDRHVNGKMTVSKTGKTAVTNYVVEERGKNYSILRLLLETGRTHQIRVHLSYIGHPILGDTLYGSNIMEKRYLLHSHEINFIHPFTGKIIKITAKIPDDIKKYIKKSLL